MPNIKDSAERKEDSDFRQRMKAAVVASYKAAQKLTAVGMPVVVARDGGSFLHTTLKSLPWQLGHGAWVAKVGDLGAYDCARITPAREWRRAS